MLSFADLEEPVNEDGDKNEEAPVEQTLDVYEKLMQSNGKTLLNLMGCNLKCFPIDVFEIKRLDCLLMTNNAISYIPDEIGQLQNLEVLVMQGNGLEQMNAAIGKSIHSTKELRSMKVYDAILSNEYPDQIERANMSIRFDSFHRSNTVMMIIYIFI